MREEKKKEVGNLQELIEELMAREFDYQVKIFYFGQTGTVESRKNDEAGFLHRGQLSFRRRDVESGHEAWCEKCKDAEVVIKAELTWYQDYHRFRAVIEPKPNMMEETVIDRKVIEKFLKRSCSFRVVTIEDDSRIIFVERLTDYKMDLSALLESDLSWREALNSCGIAKAQVSEFYNELLEFEASQDKSRLLKDIERFETEKQL